ncbi:hypothetical protein [Bombilactobacillus thymidiniphilus]|uniref:Uncharacterized protein n=1 Tax=Bombilactobacillus thymidiniphilus TaxID=2923363 RepID=A0ABY4PD29_9LACO|nr:hypothetical protein [Bombilactobacillus thymidiniphilus]UQS83674.1 hypothetical protein MOO47_00280 [Bombilactobacillus thymidiniphilus]
MYVEGNYYNLTGDQNKFVYFLEKANELSPNKIQYMISLAKAYKLTNNFTMLRNILDKIRNIVPVSQLDKRRKFEAMAMLMRLDPNIELEI